MTDRQPMMSGGPITPFSQGWAIIPFSGERPHYWVEDKETMPPQIADKGRVRYYTSRCGIVGVTNDAVPALAPGGFSEMQTLFEASMKYETLNDYTIFQLRVVLYLSKQRHAPQLGKISNHFGLDCDTASGRLRRGKLAEVVKRVKVYTGLRGKPYGYTLTAAGNRLARKIQRSRIEV